MPVEIKNLNGEVIRTEDGDTLVGADLTRADLSAANLSGANLYHADLSAANLSGANLYRADLSAANLIGADLYRADLSAANLSGANLYRADLSAANLYRADLSAAKGILCIGPVGQHGRIIYAWLKEGEPMVNAGCFSDTLASFRKAVKTKYGDTDPAYLATVPMIRAWAKMEKERLG